MCLFHVCLLGYAVCRMAGLGPSSPPRKANALWCTLEIGSGGAGVQCRCSGVLWVILMHCIKRQAWFHIIQEPLMKINHNKSPVSTTTQYYCVFHSVDSARQDLPIEQREYVHMPVPIR